MRRVISGFLVAVLAGCGGDSLLGPVTSCAGEWSGTQNGYALGMTLSQTDSTVTGTARLQSNIGFADGTVSGTCASPNVKLTISVPQFGDVAYFGTLSVTAAQINARLNGQGFVNLELDVAKK